ncbi:MAG TPA: bifunctional 4-hydroxy-2-oxoglutarate aldolase/2-dehydro-3-deoxy-phosphogluconate aldolase [Bryobacteraceae bacterium]|jgi:2-dehydro-3-deoxyphosphogluconate aldolase/(4S)-4-hydroxy-2-oxoglutarate aldolase|nr:bifunctional 4-hydroxy-2-oxoglutarate aldolase/2-dehydro-3-deoxy-phosphogluconate aldolase [Bryobacteraceae bacterium]
MTKADVRARIEEIGIIPAIRLSSIEDARFAAESVFRAGLPIAEIPLTVPGALDLISDLVRNFPDMVVGAGTVLDADTARRAIEAGARFITSTGMDAAVVGLAVEEDVLVLPGALTPTEIINAWKAGADFVKVFPCASLGGDSYIRALKTALPQIRLIAGGGVQQHTAGHYISAGASAIGVGKELITYEAVRLRKPEWILELAHRFMGAVKNARSHTASAAVVRFK